MDIVRAEIHPGIGIARVGNSTAEDGYLIGPEVAYPAPRRAGESRDETGAILRQAARFRIYGFDVNNNVVAEIDADSAEIEWTVHLANKKAAWYRFGGALDIPEAEKLSMPLRNAAVRGSHRKQLVIDPGPLSIRGKNVSGPKYQADGGSFMNTPVSLGEIRTDDAGRLLVLGGHGNSGSPQNKPLWNPKEPGTFANADGWYDDVSDGPVTATVTIGNRPIPVHGAWVVVGPPNYAPDLRAWRTLYDLLYDVHVRSGWLAVPETVSFTEHVLPVLQRLSDLQWVNKGLATMFGHGCPMDFYDPVLIGKLAHRPDDDAPDPFAQLRQIVYNSFRRATTKVDERQLWPWLYGDAYGFNVEGSPRNSLPMPHVRDKMLERWVAGDFVADWNPDARPPHTLAQVPLPDQPDMLSKAALDFCIADAFHPGCELTWPMRHATMYRGPFRVRRREVGESPLDYGEELTQESALALGGPLYAQGPGDLTRWMALPWQADTAMCRSGYNPEYDPYLPTFWPARVPNQVLSEEDYARARDTKLPIEERVAAYSRRDSWTRVLEGETKKQQTPEYQMEQMVKIFGDMGILEAREGVKGNPALPAVMLVESRPKEDADADTAAEDAKRKGAHPGTEKRRAQPASKQDRADKKKESAAAGEAEKPARRSRIERAGWRDHDQLKAFRRVRGRE